MSHNEDYVDVTIVEFAAHTAYLDPATGTGYLVVPLPERDVAAPADVLTEAAWSDQLTETDRGVRLSLHEADRESALAQLAADQWLLLFDEEDRVDRAGQTHDGRDVLCLHGPPPPEEPTLEAIRRAVIALDIAVGIRTRT
ncbi:hypothetical protein ABZS29_16905 [Kribbella sp. NPDC005582]|uniref:hypothetical protein n=1 Tax=Kribbella sp. NPDC005582 TaxID=3156893 RepID=UPI0033A3C474